MLNNPHDFSLSALIEERVNAAKVYHFQRKSPGIRSFLLLHISLDDKNTRDDVLGKEHYAEVLITMYQHKALYATFNNQSVHAGVSPVLQPVSQEIDGASWLSPLPLTEQW